MCALIFIFNNTENLCTVHLFLKKYSVCIPYIINKKGTKGQKGNQSMIGLKTRYKIEIVKLGKEEHFCFKATTQHRQNKTKTLI